MIPTALQYKHYRKVRQILDFLKSGGTVRFSLHTYLEFFDFVQKMTLNHRHRTVSVRAQDYPM